jgi:hypothetical protein
MELQALEIGLPEKPRPTVAEFDEAARALLAWAATTGCGRNPVPPIDTRPKRTGIL